MARQHGISTDTYERIIIDSGAVYKDYGVAVRTITLNTVIATDAVTVTVDGTATTFSFVSSNSTGNQVLLGVSDTAAATNLATAITALTGVTAAGNSNVVTVTGDNALVTVVCTTSDTTITLGSNGLNSTLLGATRGGSTFTIETEYKTMEVDGARGSVVGSRRITGVMAKLVANFIEMSKDLMEIALPGSSSADYPASSATHDLITRSLAIGASDYMTNVAIVGEETGSSVPVILMLDNALSDGNFEIKFADKDENVTPVQFTAHFAANALDTEPWKIYYPKHS